MPPKRLPTKKFSDVFAQCSMFTYCAVAFYHVFNCTAGARKGQELHNVKRALANHMASFAQEPEAFMNRSRTIPLCFCMFAEFLRESYTFLKADAECTSDQIKNLYSTYPMWAKPKNMKLDVSRNRNPQEKFDQFVELLWAFFKLKTDSSRVSSIMQTIFM